MSYLLKEGDVFELLPEHEGKVNCKNGFHPGKYVVESARFSESLYTPFEKQWSICAALLSDQTKKAYFYQTGMVYQDMANIQPIGKAEKVWIELVNIQ